MNNQAQYPQPQPQQQNQSSQDQDKPLLVRAIDVISVILAIITAIFVTPFIRIYTQDFFVRFMNMVIGDFGELWEFAWWMICYLLVGWSALAFFHVKLTTMITKYAMRNFDK